MFLDLDNNRLSGAIPTEFGNLVNLRELDLDKNQLSGTIPTELGKMINVWELDLSKSESFRLEGSFLLLNCPLPCSARCSPL